VSHINFHRSSLTELNEVSNIHKYICDRHDFCAKSSGDGRNLLCSCFTGRYGMSNILSSLWRSSKFQSNDIIYTPYKFISYIYEFEVPVFSGGNKVSCTILLEDFVICSFSAIYLAKRWRPASSLSSDAYKAMRARIHQVTFLHGHEVIDFPIRSRNSRHSGEIYPRDITYKLCCIQC
jgi:hypothetical protein